MLLKFHDKYERKNQKKVCKSIKVDWKEYNNSSALSLD